MDRASLRQAIEINKQTKERIESIREDLRQLKDSSLALVLLAQLEEDNETLRASMEWCGEVWKTLNQFTPRY